MLKAHKYIVTSVYLWYYWLLERERERDRKNECTYFHVCLMRFLFLIFLINPHREYNYLHSTKSMLSAAKVCLVGWGRVTNFRCKALPFVLGRAGALIWFLWCRGNRSTRNKPVEHTHPPLFKYMTERGRPGLTTLFLACRVFRMY